MKNGIKKLSVKKNVKIVFIDCIEENKHTVEKLTQNTNVPIIAIFKESKS